MASNFGFSLVYREQQQLFMFDKTYLAAILFRIGGLSTLAAQFIVQFFRTPGAALCITLALLALCAFLLWASSPKDRRSPASALLCLVPALLMWASLHDNQMHYDVLVSFLFSLLGLLVYDRCGRKAAAGALITLVLYLTAGPAALLFGLDALLSDIFAKTGKGRLVSLAYPLLALVCGVAAWRSALAPTLGSALLPSMFYDLDTPMPWQHILPWAAAPLAVLLQGALGRGRSGKKLRNAVAAVLVTATLLPSVSIGRRFVDNGLKLTREFEYYASREDWEGLKEACRRNEWLPRTANYLNMALAYQGKLCGKLFKYDQRGPMSLVLNSAQEVDVTLARVMFAMGNMAAAQNIAFNAIWTTTGYYPEMMKICALVDIMRGEYEVADKYLRMLGKSIYHRDWARRYRAFLYDDAAVEADPLLGTGRRDFPEESAFVMMTNPMDDILRVLETNPSDSRAMDYGLSYLLLAKDMDSTRKFVERFYGSPGLVSLPGPAQEALLFYSEFSRNVGGVEPVSLEWCFGHGVTPGTVQRFEAWQQACMRSGGAAPKGFEDTFWYYLLYTAI